MKVASSKTLNEEDDVYYVTIKTGEPSYCIEVDDTFVLELGIFTNLPTGFRILNFKKNRVTSTRINTLIKKIKTFIKHEIDLPNLHDREAQVKQALEEALAK